MSAIINMVLVLWELPQNMLGVANLLLHASRGSDHGSLIRTQPDVHQGQSGAVSLGFFIFWSDTGSERFRLDVGNKLHEYGHSVQSRMFGPFYLLVVGIPSVVQGSVCPPVL